MAAERRTNKKAAPPAGAEERRQAPAATTDVPAMPAGFMPLNPTRGGDEVCWFSPEGGITILGILLGRFRRKSGANVGKYYYQIRLTAPTRARVRDDKELHDIPKGWLIEADERKALDDLIPFCVPGSAGSTQVYIQVHDKVSLKGGRTFWPMDVAVKAPAGFVPVALPDTVESDADGTADSAEVPF